MRSPEPSARVVVDPNSVARSDPSLSVVLADLIPPHVGQGSEILAVVPDEDGYLLAPALVVRIAGEIAWIRVNWQAAYEMDSDQPGDGPDFAEGLVEILADYAPFRAAANRVLL